MTTTEAPDFEVGDVVTGPFNSGRDCIVIVTGRVSDLPGSFAGYLFGNSRAEVRGVASEVEKVLGKARQAIVTGESLSVVQRYLPSNYRAETVGDGIMIEGWDSLGWTLDDYVIPRLHSGFIRATEVTR